MNKAMITLTLAASTLLASQMPLIISSAQANEKATSEMTPEKLKTNMLDCIDTLKGIAAIKAKNVPNKKKTSLNLYMTAKGADAYLKKHKEAILIDVRTPEETMFVGMATKAAKNIPFMFVDHSKYSTKKKRYTMKRNVNFVKEADKFLKSKDLDEFSTIIFICRSGSRSSKAVNALAEAGYDNIYTVIDGFEGDKNKKGQRTVNGWKNAGLPWSYKIAPEKRYRHSVKVAHNSYAQ